MKTATIDHAALRKIHNFLKPLAERWRETPAWHSMAADNTAWHGEIHITVRDLKEANDILRDLETRYFFT